MKLSFFLKKSTSNEYYVNASISHNYEQVKFSTGIKISKKSWDKKNKTILSGSIVDKKGRAKIERLKAEFEDYTYKFPDKSLLDVRWFLKGNKEESSSITFSEYIDGLSNSIEGTYNRNGGRNLSPNYAKGFKTLSSHINDYINYTEKDLSFKDINEAFADEYTSYLANEKELSANTISKDLKLIKTAMNKALRLGLCKVNAFSDVEIKIQQVHKIALNEIEIKSIERLLLGKREIKNKGREQINLDIVRTTFLITCYLGIRHSEFSDISQNSLDKKRRTISILERKTKKIRISPLPPQVISLLESIDYHLYDGTQQKYNKHLKTIMSAVPELKIAEYYMENKGGTSEKVSKPRWEFISSHTGRRTAATRLFKSCGDIHKVMQFMGFESEKVAWGYVIVSEEEKANKLGENFGWFIGENGSKEAS